MEQSEYVGIKLSDIPQEFIEEYDLTQASQNGWIYCLLETGAQEVVDKLA